MALNFPLQTIFEKDKTPEWCSKHLDYAQDVYKASNSRRSKMTSDFNSYNGIKAPDSLNWLTKRYGSKNTAHYISYRAHVPKMKLRKGEFLASPLAATVQTTNKDARSEKMRQMDLYLGAMAARHELLQLKDKVGVDVMEGAEIPVDESDPLWEQLSPKDKEETIMQIILNEYIIEDDLKIKFANDVGNRDITSVMFGKVERNEEGETTYKSIDPREAIFEEIKGDMFLEKSPLMGSASFIAIHDALKKYRLTTEQIKLINSISENPAQYAQRSNGYMRMLNGGLQIMEMHIEWKSVIPSYFKKLKKTDSQKAIDESENYIMQAMSTEEYEKNKDWHDKQVEKGKYEIVVKYREDIWEATRLGGLRELDVNRRRALFQMRSVDDPTRITGMSYCGCLLETVDGIRISLMNELENLSNVLDITMYKILSDVIRAKGRTIGFNLAALSKNSTVEKTMKAIYDEGFLTYDTSATGNIHQKDVSVNNIISEYDSGLSNSFPQLVQFVQNILTMMDEMTGFNQNRTGDIAASATVSNTQQSISASRTITALADYATYLYITKVLTKVVDSAKITWGLYKTEKGEQILGTDKFRFLQVTQQLGYKDYGVHIQDGRKYAEVTQFMDSLMETSLNAKEIRPEDALNYKLAETYAEQRNVMKQAWATVKKFTSDQQQQQLQAQQQMQQQQQQFQMQQQKDMIEDSQAHDIDKIVVKGDVDIKVNDAKAGNKVIEQQQKNDLESQNNMFN